MEYVDFAEPQAPKNDMSGLWQWIATIVVTLAISLGVNYISDSSKYMTEAQVDKMIIAKKELTDKEMQYNKSALDELKQVVQNNNIVMQEVVKELAVMRQKLEHYIDKNAK